MHAENQPEAVELILYACPVGPLADHIQRYFAAARHRFSWNPAHDYMPHCSITGFFHDLPPAIPGYVEAIDTVLKEYPPADDHPVIEVRGMLVEKDFHGLVLQSDWLSLFTTTFVTRAPTTTRSDALRIKDWLHLSLAYHFPAGEGPSLSCLARQTVPIDAPVCWQMRLYQRHRDKSWTLHGHWSLDAIKESCHVAYPTGAES